MIEYYEYETSPRKLQPNYDIKSDKNKKNIKRNSAQMQDKQRKNNVGNIIEIAIGFAVLLVISCRYSLINTSFNEKEKLKTELAVVQKKNAQLQVNIEQGMNINTIEQEAKERLGMQKLDNNQKVYVSLSKQDYTESSTDTVINEKTESWWQKLLKILKGE